MGYTTSKTQYEEINKGRVFFTLLISFICLTSVVKSSPLAAQECAANATSGSCTAVSTGMVTVHALVLDPNATTTATTTEPSTPPPSSGGGGGGSNLIPATQNDLKGKLSMQGYFAPGSTVKILFGGVINRVIAADTKGFFSTTFEGLNQGLYTVSLVAFDSNSPSFLTETSYTLYVTATSETMISNITFPPLLILPSSEVVQGEVVYYGGKSYPGSQISLFIDSLPPVTISALKNGAFSYQDKSSMSLGRHVIKTKLGSATSTASLSKGYELTVVAEKSQAPKKDIGGSKADFSSDCHINLIDFSILAYWHNRNNFPKKYDLNHDGKIDIKDFSIMAYYWTG